MGEFLYHISEGLEPSKREPINHIFPLETNIRGSMNKHNLHGSLN